jgi:REP element-mobilizing transposase RayT
MNRGTARQATFLTAEDHQAFLDTLAEAHRQWDIEIFGYCLMTNHYHVCLRTPKGNLSRVMRHVDGLYTQRFNRSHGRDGPLFRGRYKAILIDADEYLSAVVRYIHLNPVEAGIVKMPEDYRWSSHGYYLRKKGVPNWVSTSEIIGQVGGRNAFHDFVLSGNEEALSRFYTSSRHSPVLGGEGFVERIREPTMELGREHPRYERRGLWPNGEQVIGKVAGFYKISKDAVLTGVRGRENKARKVAMYIVTRQCDLTLQETARLFGLGSYGAVGWSCNWVRTKMEKEKTFRDQIERIFHIWERCQVY